MKMDMNSTVIHGNQTVINALMFLMDASISCGKFFDQTDVSILSAFCCMDVYQCLDLSIYPELLEDVDVYSKNDSFCDFVSYMPECMDWPGCYTYKEPLRKNFQPAIDVLLDKYTYNGTCPLYNDTNYDYDYEETLWSNWSPTVSPFEVATDSTGSDIGVIVGAISGTAVFFMVVLVTIYIWKTRCKDSDKSSETAHENAAYHMDHRPSAEYDVINAENEVRYVKLDLNQKRSIDEQDSNGSMFTLGSTPPKSDYSGLKSEFHRYRLERQYTTLSQERGPENSEETNMDEKDYITQPESVPDFGKLRSSAQLGSLVPGVGPVRQLSEEEADYFIPRPEPPALPSPRVSTTTDPCTDQLSDEKNANTLPENKLSAQYTQPDPSKIETVKPE